MVSNVDKNSEFSNGSSITGLLCLGFVSQCKTGLILLSAVSLCYGLCVTLQGVVLSLLVFVCFFFFFL